MPNIMDMTLAQLQDAGIDISIQINTWPRRGGSNPPTPTQPSKAQLRDALHLYADKFGGPAARKLIGEGTTLETIKNPTQLYQQIFAELDAAVPPGGKNYALNKV